MRSSAGWRVHALGGLSGALYFLAFPPFSLRPLGWIALAPLLLALRRATRPWQAVLAGAAAGMVLTMGGYFWIGETAHRFWQVPWAFAIFLLALYGTFAEIHFTVFAALAWVLRRRLAGRPVIWTALLFTGCEMLVPRIFPDKLGHSQLDVGALPYAAALVGTHGLSFVLAWLAASLVALFDARRGGDRRRAAVELATCALALGGLVIYGVGRRAALTRMPQPRALEVVLVQSNLGDPEELANSLGSVTGAIDSTVTMYAGLTTRALEERRADLVVWPETAVPSVPRPRILTRLQDLTTAFQVPLVFGAYDSERAPGSHWRVYNAAFYMLPTGEVRERYYKNKLLLFGEYVPLSDRFPRLLNLLPTPGEFTPGPGPRTFRVGDVGLTPLVCYELLFPRLVRAAMRAGGEVIVNLTNDYWFGRRLEPQQHLALARMCALETGRPILRATNTGISAVIDHRGAVLAQTEVWVQGVLRARLPVPPMSWTPYARWGEATTALLALAAILAVLAAWRFVPGGTTAPPASRAGVEPAPRAARQDPAGKGR